MKPKDSLNKGFTLIELMVGLALWMVVALAVVNLSRAGLRLWKQTENTAPQHQEARAILNQIAREFRNSIDVPGVGWSVSSSVISFATVQSERIMKVTYKLESEEKGTLLKSIQQELSPRGPQPAVETLLTAHASGLAWEYAYLSPQTTIEWRGDWKPATGEPMPSGVRVTLTLLNDKAEPEIYKRTIFAPAARTIPWAR